MADIKFTPNETQSGKWFRNIRLFFAPIALIYLTVVAGTLAGEGHVISLKDFIPTTFVQGGIALYLVNSVIDYFKKVKAS